MADLGTLATRLTPFLSRRRGGDWAERVRVIMVGGHVTRPARRGANNGVIAGTLYEGASPAGAKVVYCYHKAYGELAASTVSDSLGRYTLTGLDTSVLYTVVAIDGSGTYNAVVQDGVKPAFALSGSASALSAASGALL